MKIFIVEDDVQKSDQLISCLSESFELPEIEVFRSFNSGLTALKTASPDVLILDMTLPTFDRTPGIREGRLRPLGGYEMMRKLKLFKRAHPTIIVSQLESFGEGPDEVGLEEVSKKCASEFPDMYRGSVKFHLGGSEWKAKLRRMIVEAIS